MRLGLYKRLLLIAVLPAALVALALGIGAGWESVAVTRAAARATAQIEAIGLTHSLVIVSGGHPALPPQILAGSGIIKARLVNNRGDLISSRTRLGLPLPPRRGLTF